MHVYPAFPVRFKEIQCSFPHCSEYIYHFTSTKQHNVSPGCFPFSMKICVKKKKSMIVIVQQGLDFGKCYILLKFIKTININQIMSISVIYDRTFHCGTARG